MIIGRGLGRGLDYSDIPSRPGCAWFTQANVKGVRHIRGAEEGVGHSCEKAYTEFNGQYRHVMESRIIWNGGLRTGLQGIVAITLTKVETFVHCGWYHPLAVILGGLGGLQRKKLNTGIHCCLLPAAGVA